MDIRHRMAATNANKPYRSNQQFQRDPEVDLESGAAGAAATTALSLDRMGVVGEVDDSETEGGEQEITAYDILITGEGKSSNSAREAESIVTTSMQARIGLWVVFLVAGLSVNFLIEMSRFWWLTVTLVPALLWFVITPFTVTPFILLAIGATEAIGIAATFIIGYNTAISIYECGIVGDMCPESDDSDTALKRGVDVALFIYFFVQCCKSLGKFYQLKLIYEIDETLILRRYYREQRRRNRRERSNERKNVRE